MPPSRRPRRPVTIEHLQRQFLPRKFLLHGPEAKPHVPLDHAFHRAIARNRPAHEIVYAGVADVLDDGWIDVAQEREVAGQALRSGR